MKKIIFLIIAGLVASNFFLVGVVIHYQGKANEAIKELNEYKNRSFAKKVLNLFREGSEQK